MTERPEVPICPRLAAGAHHGAHWRTFILKGRRPLRQLCPGVTRKEAKARARSN